MEQQGSRPCTSSTADRDNRPARASPTSFTTPQPNVTTDDSDNEPKLLTPTTPSVPASNPLSTSEPSLRFPRPQGNRRLANWVSTSNPDIMRVTTEDTGLSESTYELVSGTDTESQDGNYTESISESIGSLDFHRPDDVHSLAGTEHTYDDESVADDAESMRAPVDESQPQDTALPDTTPQLQNEQLVEQPQSDGEAEAESDDEARSRSSLEYTQQSLKTPSIPTPEASKIVDRPGDAAESSSVTGDAQQDLGSQQARLQKWLSDMWDAEFQVWDSVVEASLAALPGVIFSLIVLLFIPILYSPAQPNDAPAIPTTTPLATTAPTSSISLSTTSLSSLPRALSTSTHGDSGLLPLENAVQDEWLFTGKQLDLTVSKRHGDFLVHIPKDIKQVWLSKNCLDLTANRGDEDVRILVTSVEDGIAIKVPKGEAHGTVRFNISTSCRPKIRKVLRVAFDKGIIQEVLELTKTLTQDINDLVPVIAQEVERKLEAAKRAMEGTPWNMKSRSHCFFEKLNSRFVKAHRSLSFIKADARGRIEDAKGTLTKQLNGLSEQVAETFHDTQSIMEQAHLGLLDAQISAKLWWLKVTGAKDEHARYQRGAREFWASKQGEAKTDHRARRYWDGVFQKLEALSRVQGNRDQQ